MDWISLLKAQQTDFVQRLKKPKTYDLSLLESQVKGYHSEIVPLWSETYTNMRQWASEQSVILAQNPPPLPPEYPDDPEWGIPFPKYFERQAHDYLMRAQVVERAISIILGKLVKQVAVDLFTSMNLDEEGNLRSESTFPYVLASQPDIKIQVRALDGTSFNAFKKDKIRWLVSQEDIKNNQVIVFLSVLSHFLTDVRGYEKPTVVGGFLPTNQIQFCEPKTYIPVSQLLYAGGLSFYLESLKYNQEKESETTEILTESSTQTLDQKHPLKSIIGDWKCWKTLQGHSRGINCLALNSIGEDKNELILASGSRGESKLWDLTSGNLITTFSEYPWVTSGQLDEVSSLVFSPDGNTLISGGADSTIKLWHMGANDLIDILQKHNGMVRCISFTANNRILATGGDDRKILFWDLIERQVIFSLSLDDTAAHSLSFTSDGEKLVTGSYRKIKIWRVCPQPGKKSWDIEIINTLTGHTHIVTALVISHDNKKIISASKDKTIKIWNLETGELVHTLKGHKDSIQTLAFSPDGQIIASGSADKTIKLWHLESGDLLGTFSGHGNTVTAVVFSSCGSILVSASLDTTIKVWLRNSTITDF
jgi:WD40 repeat protein